MEGAVFHSAFGRIQRLSKFSSDDYPKRSAAGICTPAPSIVGFETNHAFDLPD